jgi:hypothetical protein
LAAAEPPPTEAAAEPPSTTERIPDAEGVPAPQDDVQAGPPVYPADNFFPLLQVGRVMRDKLQKVEDSMLRASFEHALMRVAMYVELTVRPTDNDKLSATVPELSIFQQAKDADGRRIIGHTTPNAGSMGRTLTRCGTAIDSSQNLTTAILLASATRFLA